MVGTFICGSLDGFLVRHLLVDLVDQTRIYIIDVKLTTEKDLDAAAAFFWLSYTPRPATQSRYLQNSKKEIERT